MIFLIVLSFYCFFLINSINLFKLFFAINNRLFIIGLIIFNMITTTCLFAFLVDVPSYLKKGEQIETTISAVRGTRLRNTSTYIIDADGKTYWGLGGVPSSFWDTYNRETVKISYLPTTHFMLRLEQNSNTIKQLVFLVDGSKYTENGYVEIYSYNSYYILVVPILYCIMLFSKSKYKY